MPLSAGAVDITTAVLSSWQAVIVMVMVCVTRMVVAAIRSDGPISRAAAAAFTGWIRRRRQNR